MDETAIEGRVAAEAMEAYAQGYAAGMERGQRLWRRVAWGLFTVICLMAAAAGAVWNGLSGG